ncbi:MAG TPA: hypothetical protein VF188_17540 [Longimicrobiales bacterium]
MREPKTYRAHATYFDTDGEPLDGGVRGFIHPRPLRGDHAVILLADTPEIREMLASVGLHVQPRRDEIERRPVAVEAVA